MLDADSLTVQLCIAGMEVEGSDPGGALGLFRRAWDTRRDAYEASIAAHYVARHQPSAEDTLHWNRVAVEYAEAVLDDRAKPLLASLYLNLGDSYVVVGQLAEAAAAADRGLAALRHLPAEGYRELVTRGLHRLLARISEAGVAPDVT